MEATADEPDAEPSEAPGLQAAGPPNDPETPNTG
jgi:hypothetical protein